MNYNKVKSIHGNDEYGKDVIFYSENPLGLKEWGAIQAEANKIHGNIRKEEGNVNDLINHIERAFRNPWYSHYYKKKIYVSKLYLISNHEITNNAIEDIKNEFSTKPIYFIDGRRLVELIERYDFPILDKEDILNKIASWYKNDKFHKGELIEKLDKIEIDKMEKLTPRRKKILDIIEEYFSYDKEFSNKELNKILKEKEIPSTTLNLLDQLVNSGLLTQVNVGGNPILLAELPNEENEIAFEPENQKKLAQEMISKTEIDLDPNEFDWGSHEDRTEFCEMFNALTEEKCEHKGEPIQLIPTFTRNTYRLPEDVAKMI